MITQRHFISIKKPRTSVVARGPGITYTPNKKARGIAASVSAFLWSKIDEIFQVSSLLRKAKTLCYIMSLFISLFSFLLQFQLITDRL